jgi:ArsR family transcriptional regulator
VGEVGTRDVERAALEHGGADAVFAVRLLHHAPKPQVLLESLARLTAPGGAALVVDYAPHDDESMRAQADVWLGFDPNELASMARAAGFDEAMAVPIAHHLVGAPASEGDKHASPDAHLPWQVLVARRTSAIKK